MYIGEFVYKNNVLSYIITPEGRAVPKTGVGGKNTIATNKFLYNGKELQSDYNFDLYSLSRCIGNYGARFYDGQLGRWFDNFIASKFMRCC